MQTLRGAGPSARAAGHRVIFIFIFFPLASFLLSDQTRAVELEVSLDPSGRGRPPARQPPKPGKEGVVGSGNGAQGGSEAAGGKRGNRKSPSPAGLPRGEGPGPSTPPPRPTPPKAQSVKKKKKSKKKKKEKAQHSKN